MKEVKLIRIHVDGQQYAFFPQDCTWDTFTTILSDCIDGTQKKVVIEFD